jgi:hypothetical protein
MYTNCTYVIELTLSSLPKAVFDLAVTLKISIYFFLNKDYGTYLVITVPVFQSLRHKAVKAVTFLDHPRPSLDVVFDFHRPFPTFTSEQRFLLEDYVRCIFPQKFLFTAPPPPFRSV